MERSRRRNGTADAPPLLYALSAFAAVTSSPHRSRGHPSPVRFGSHFIHPGLPASSFSRAGRGSGVEGFSSGPPDPRPALQAIRNTMMLYKYSPTHLPCCTFEKAGISSNNILKRLSALKWCPPPHPLPHSLQGGVSIASGRGKQQQGNIN